MKLQCNLSHDFNNKQLRPDKVYPPHWCKEHQCKDTCYTFNTFYPQTIPPDELAAHILSGKAWTPHAFKGKWRNGKEWVSSQILALDLDHCPLNTEQLASDPRIKDTAYLVYPSPSSKLEHPKTRIIFILSDVITDWQRWRQYQVDFFALFADLEPDLACKSPAQFFYGSTVEGAIQLGNIIPLATVEALTEPFRAERERHAAEREQMRKQNPPRPIDPQSSRAEQLAQKWLNRACDELAAATPDTRHGLLFKKAAYLFGLMKGDWPLTESDITHELERAAQTNGMMQKYGTREITRTIDDALAAATPKPVVIQDKPKKQRSKGKAQATESDHSSERIIHPAPLPPFTADFTANVRYLTEIDLERLGGKKTLAIKSPTGTGKTEFTAQLTKGLPTSASILVLTHRVSLVKANAQRFDILDYKSFDEQDAHFVSSAPQIASTVDSLQRQQGRQFDYVFIDEFVQVLRHIASAGTTKGRTIQLYEIAKQIIHDAKRVIVADANLNNDALAWLRGVRGEVYAVENVYRPTRPDTLFLDSPLASVQRTIQLVKDDKGTILIPCATQKDARRIHKLLKREYPAKRGEIITARNSETKHIKAFVADINERLLEYDWLTYTSSMGTGVDIQTPVYAVVGIFGMPITPADALQMMSRARNAEHRYAYAPLGGLGGEPNPDVILSQQINAAAMTTAATGAAAPDGHAVGHARLKAILDAGDNAATERFADTFAAYLEADGSHARYETQIVSATVKALWKEASEAEKEAEKALTLDTVNIPTVTREQFDQLRINEQETTDEIHAGYLRWKIEDATGLSVNERLYDTFHTPKQRRRLERFASLIDDQTALAELDKTNALDRQPLHRRHNWTAKQELFFTIIKRVFGVDSMEQLKAVLVNMSKDELAAKAALLTEQDIDAFKTLLNYREGHDASLNNGVGVIRWFLAQYGIQLKGHQIRQGKERTYAYSIDTQEYDYWIEVSCARLAALQEKREEECLSQNRQDIGDNDEFVTQPPYTPQKSDIPPAAPTRKPFEPLIINTKPPVRGNPFAKVSAAV